VPWKTIYASYSENLGVDRNLNLQRLITSQRYQNIFPDTVIGATGWQMNTSHFEYVQHAGSFRNATVAGGITGMATVMSVDKAGTEGGDGAFTAIVIMHKMKDGTFVIERRRQQLHEQSASLP
jgi:hypothetical protein